MSAAEDMRRGWCPGALRPMRTGDGLLVRLRLSCGVLPVPLARKIAGWASRFGNGHIDLSQRGNLQLRGVNEATLPALTAALAAAGLLDASRAAEAVRNVLASPLAGLDPDMTVDVRPIAAALEHRLTERPELHRLPAKFSWLVDGGGALPLDGVAADVRFRASGSRLDVGLARPFGIAWLAPVAAQEVADRAEAIARWFLAQGVRRMRDVPDDALEPSRLGVTAPAAGAMAGPVRIDGRTIATLAALPFGRTDAGGLVRLCEIAGERELRLTPFRAIAIPGAAEGLEGAGFIADPSDPRLRIEACPGAPACVSASTATLVDATRIAGALAGRSAGPTIHVSGCAKGCAHPGEAEITLVGSAGRYGLVRNGTARRTPAEWLAPADLPAILEDLA